jgi:hypothetical protein
VPLAGYIGPKLRTGVISNTAGNCADGGTDNRASRPTDDGAANGTGRRTRCGTALGEGTSRAGQCDQQRSQYYFLHHLFLHGFIYERKRE